MPGSDVLEVAMGVCWGSLGLVVDVFASSRLDGGAVCRWFIIRLCSARSCMVFASSPIELAS